MLIGIFINFIFHLPIKFNIILIIYLSCITICITVALIELTGISISSGGFMVLECARLWIACALNVQMNFMAIKTGIKNEKRGKAKKNNG